MGVRGLTTYINFNEDVFLKTFFLHDTSLIIDGHSLCAQLYRSLNCFSAFGGDYDKFAACVKTFFKNLRKCHITGYVLFDGSYETRKLKTAYSRLRSKICGASRLDPVTQGGLQIFPMLLRDVFKEIIRDMGISYTTCEFEADDEIAAMARHLNCPVLSYDSDFFIYNVLYIPFNTLDYRPTPIEENGNKVFALECKIYRVEQLTKHFGGLKEELLPLLATLLGNDYVEKRVFNKFFSQLKLPKSKKKKNEQQRCIHGLFKWLQNETLESAISKILGRLKKKQKDRVLAILKKSIEGYHKKHCRSLEYFNIVNNIEESVVEFGFPHIVGNNYQFADEELVNENEIVNIEGIDIQKEIYESDYQKEIVNNNDAETGEDDEVSSEEDNSKEDSDIEEHLILGLPEWFAKGIRQNNIPHSYINLYTHSLHFCSPQAEDYKDQDSFLCTLPILRYAFDIIADYSREDCLYISREKDNAYRKILVDKEYSVPRAIDIPLQDLSDDQLKSCFNHFIKEKMPLLDVSLIDLLPPNFQLFMISLVWWVQTCDVPLGNVHSLLISYIMLEVIDEKTGTFRGHFHFNNKYSKKIDEFKKNSSSDKEDTKLFLNKNKVQYEDCMIAASVLLKHFELDEKIKKRPKSYDIRKIHSFAQFQCCLSQFNNLNLLCRKPFEVTTYSKCYNGTFVYNIADKLENQVDPVSFFDQYLKGAVTVLRFYKSLFQIYTRCAEIMGLVNKKWEGKKRRRRKNNNVDEELNFIIKGFESEVII